MSVRGVGITVGFVAWDATNNVGKTGDSANFTLRWGKDGTYSAPTNSASEVDSTNAPGEYKITLTNAEANCDFGQLTGKSSTSGIVIMPTRISFDSFPATRINIAQAGASGTITLDASASATDSLYNGLQVEIIAGTGAGQGGRIITGYVGSTKVATVTPAWTTTPDSTSVFALAPATVNVQTFGGTAGTFSGGRPEVNATHAAGTAWNSGAIGASTLASNTITAAKVATDAIGAAQLAADAVTEIATAVGGLTIAANLTEIEGDNTFVSGLNTFLQDYANSAFNASVTGVSGDVSGKVLGGGVGTIGGAGVWAFRDDGSSAAPASTALSSATWTNAKAAFITGDTFGRLGAPAGASVSADIAAVNAKTTNLPASPAAVGSAMTLTSAYDFAKGTVAVTESYNADGAAPTPVQALFVIMQMLTEMSISGTTMTVKKLDGSTAAFTLTLNDATTPTSLTRAT